MSVAVDQMPEWNLRRLSGAMGAEIWGIDIETLDDAGFAKLNELLLEHCALALHGQAHVSDESLRAFGLRFGELDIHGYTPTVPGFKDMLNIRSSAERPGTAENWHSDISWKEIPPKISMLLARKIPSVGGDTFFASQYKAYDDLSDAMKAFLEPLDGLHDGRVFDLGLVGKFVEHPLVIRHPETGRKALYANGDFTHGIKQLSRTEGKAILEFIFRHASRERYQARVRYEPGTLSIWDNRCVQHLAAMDFGLEERELHRIAVLCDERPSR